MNVTDVGLLDDCVPHDGQAVLKFVGKFAGDPVSQDLHLKEKTLRPLPNYFQLQRRPYSLRSRVLDQGNSFERSF